jgi:hypothetical protein
VHQVLSDAETKNQQLIDLDMSHINALTVARTQEQADCITKEFTRLENLIKKGGGQAPKKTKVPVKSAEGLKSFLNSSLDKGFSSLGSIYSAMQKAAETTLEK